MERNQKIVLASIPLVFMCYVYIAIGFHGQGPQEEFLLPNANSDSWISLQTNLEAHKTEQNNSFYRRDDIPERTGKLPFLPNYRNPCWRELLEDRSGTRIRCLPYFYLVGAPKAGTTDLHRRLIQHPLISGNIGKEPHWLTRNRFWSGKSRNLSSYLKIFDRAVKRDITTKQHKGFYTSIFGDCSASTLWDNRKLLRMERKRNFTIPSRTNANVIYNLYNKTKIIVLLRNPVTRLYSEYLYFMKAPTKDGFHDTAVASINSHRNCLQKHSLRYCTYFSFQRSRIFIGIYYLYIEDFLRVFPKEQLKIIKLEDYSKNISSHMSDIFKFLEVGVPSPGVMKNLIESRIVNDNSKRYSGVGDMRPDTLKILKEFYKPYNDKLVQLLGDKFDFNDFLS